MSTATREVSRACRTPRDECNLDAVVIRVVNGILPNGGYSLTKVTGLSREDLIDLGTALAVAIDNTWDPNGGSRRDSWVSTMLQRRLVDIVREESPVTRSVFAVLQKIWARQELLGGATVQLHEVRDSLADDPEAKVTAARFNEAIGAWELAMAIPFSGFVAQSNPHGKYEKTEVDPGFASRHIEDEELIELHRQAVLRIVAAVRTPYARMAYGLFLYLFVGLTMKRVGQQLNLSESRISQIMSVLIPETVERAFRRKLAGFDGFSEASKLSPEARKALRAFRKESRATWHFLPEEVQDEMQNELFPVDALNDGEDLSIDAPPIQFAL